MGEYPVLFSTFLSRISLLISLSIFSQFVVAQETILQVQVLGHFYEAVVTENTSLQQKVSIDSTNADSVHYAGSIRNIDDSWVRVSNINGQWQGVVSLFGTMHSIQQGISVKEGTAAASYGLLYSQPIESTGEYAGTCGAGDEPHSMLSHVPTLTAEGDGANASTPSILSATFAEFCASQVKNNANQDICVIAEVEIAFDLLFQAAYGVQANAQALSILNIVDGHYLNDLNISIDAITVEMLANDLFDTTTNPITLLEDIDTKKDNAQIPFIKNNNALTHLVTGRDFDGFTLGVAYLGTVCRADGFSTGTSSINFEGGIISTALQAIVVAHELAHNFGSEHDGPTGNAACPENTFIMSPGVGAGLTNFSSCSVDDIKQTFSLIATPELCLDFPADVAISENVGNDGALDANREFSSAHTVTITNGFQAVNQLQIDGAINIAEGTFIDVTANGLACVVAGDSYTCTVNNPATSIALLTRVRVAENINNVSFVQTASEQTNDVQDVNADNNSFMSSFAVTDGNVTSNLPDPPSNPIPPNNISPDDTPATPTNDNEEEGGGAGSFGVNLLLPLLLLYAFYRRLA